MYPVNPSLRQNYISITQSITEWQQIRCKRVTISHLPAFVENYQQDFLPYLNESTSIKTTL